ncbi:aminotransferase class V-fold PLP-dependent enzyme [Prochlorococcus marinus]|uniref:Putative L-cysteine/cystine lyase n=1 Tax=Prochlorococcus marinus (strain MIT 9211) TaxID=93059 RepID=A9BE33_PROM4|nr:aminotransferase class V-fold PLP-dependent enzyme [Prochlorococcus marinus]ABX08343.1 putative L-cysteine/cystine lyase [Prochlorococcus marinus str. MIT 9211]
MPALANKSYFNYGGQGPLPQPSLEAIITSWQKIQELGPFTNKVWPYVNDEIEATRNMLAEICGVSKRRIGFTENVTSGCVLPLWGLTFSEGDRILISDCEHPGIVSACKELARRKSLYIDIFPVQHLHQGVNNSHELNDQLLKGLDFALNPKTRLVVLSHLLWNTGVITPIPSVAEKLNKHTNKPFLLVDAAQSFGQLPIAEAASLADIYAFTGHKWACGPEGLGAVAISPRVLGASNPTLIGWRSLKSEGSIYENNPNPFHEDARRFEVATSCIPLFAGLRSSLKLMEKEGTVTQRLHQIQRMSKALWSQLKGINGVNPILEGPPASGLISFSVASKYSSKEIVKILGRQNLWIRLLEDPTWLRACVHITSNTDEINKLVKSLNDLTKEI